MPIFLDDLRANASAPKTYNPKFFDAKLTGVGKKTGILNENRNPGHVPPHQTTSSENTSIKKRHYTNGSTEVSIIPVNILSTDAWTYMYSMPLPDVDRMALIATMQAAPANGLKSDVELYLMLEPHSVVIEETRLAGYGGPNAKGGASAGVSKKCVPSYQLFLFACEKGHAPDYEVEQTDYLAHIGPTWATANSPAKGAFYQEVTCNPKKLVIAAMSQLTSDGYVVDPKAIDDYIDDYGLYDGMCRRSEQWQTTIHTFLDNYFRNIAAQRANGGNACMNNLAAVLRRIEDYKVPLDLYRDIYASIHKYFNPADSEILCKENLNLLLSDTLHNLNANKAQLSAIPVQNPPVQVPVRKVPFSPEQRKAITCTDPLVLVQSGAGTGKALPLYTPVLTPKGWVPIGELSVGDKVIGSDGQHHKVLRIHDRGLRDGYRLTFRDGSTVETCGEHVWTTCHIVNGKEIRHDITTEQWVNERKYRHYDYLPMVKPVEYTCGDKGLPIDPYLLGALIADGSLANDTVDYAKSEDDVIREVRHAAARDGYGMYECTCATATVRHWHFSHPTDVPAHHSAIKAAVKVLGLNVKSRDKFIPDEYKTASVAQRRALLHGLFDGDGDIRTGRGYARFNTASDRLAEDVLQLLWSLGLAATKQRQKHPRGDYWSVNLLDSSWDPFVASEYAGKATGTIRPMRRSLSKAEPIPATPMRCIEVDAPDHLYVTKDFLVTHNSSTILGRIDWMIACGIKPHDIMVLSFTNAAADHITDLNPDIHSMTIARMIHTIYTMNFPGHELSTLDTIMNSIDIYFGVDDMAVRFKQVCKAVWKNDADGFTRMNNFIERHYDEVMHILDTIHQTSLELEIIICYQRIEHLQEPPEVQSKYLIIDEVQDNSIFEFIYTLKYVDKHNEALFIVGDCSQTLYEFRASNPKALNILEGSGVFTAHQLQVNYRSNQEILDFANVALRDIEANQYANIQLRANSLKQVTEQSFTDAVHFKYYRLNRLGDLPDKMVSIFANDLRPYIDACLARGEHVAFLAFTRQTIAMAEEHIKALWPGKTVVKLIPDKTHNTTIFSDFIRTRWDQVKFAPSHMLADVIVRAVMDDLSHMSGKHASIVQSKATGMLDAWKTQYGGAIAGWQTAYMAGRLTLDQLMDNTRDTMLSYEIAANAMKQALMSQRNREIKEANAQVDADFILSTIHSAKGLEFQNVVVFYRNDNVQEEDKKRMYYVAFTRAMRSEFIVGYDTVASPTIELHYNGIVENLHRIAPNVNASVQAQAVANAKAILAAQAAGKTVLAVSGQPPVLAVTSVLDDGETLTYAKDLATPDTVNGLPSDGAQAFSKVMDNTSAIAQAQAIIDAMNLAAEEAEERASVGRRSSRSAQAGDDDGQEADEA